MNILQNIKNLVSDLRLAEPVQKCTLRDHQIDAFFQGISDLGLNVVEKLSKNIRYRKVSYDYIQVVVIQVDSVNDDMFIINGMDD
jgi:hypothetical protein